MPKFQERAAGWLGDHPAAHHLRGKRLLEILGSVLLALAVMGLIGVWAAATEGYETTSIFSSNYNLTDNDHWYSKFIPGRTGQLCQPAYIPTGSLFYTTNGVFEWQMGKSFNITAVDTTGNNNILVNFNGTVKQYADNKLENCDVSGLTVDLDLLQTKVTVEVYATCIDPEWPALLHSSVTYSVNEARVLDPTLWFNQGYMVPTNPNDTSISTSLNDLASDLWKRLRAVYLRSSNSLPNIRGLRLVNDRNCALETEDKKSCFESPVTVDNTTIGFFLYANMSVTDNQNSPADWNVTTNNFVQAVIAAARYDFGVNMTNNLFTNAQSRSSLIQSIDNAENSSATMNTLEGASAFLAAAVYPPAEAGRVRTSYLCLVMHMKPPATFAISVLGFTFALFGAAFAVAVAAIKFITGKHIGDPHLDQALQAVQTRISTSRDRSSSDPSGDGHHDTESTPGHSTFVGGHKKDGSGDGSGSEALYHTPLKDRSANDKSYGQLSNFSDDSTVKGRFSSLGSMPKFTDKAGSATGSPAAGVLGLPNTERMSSVFASAGGNGGTALAAGGAMGLIGGAIASFSRKGSANPTPTGSAKGSRRGSAMDEKSGFQFLGNDFTSEPMAYAQSWLPQSAQNMMSSAQGTFPAGAADAMRKLSGGQLPAGVPTGVPTSVQNGIPAQAQNFLSPQAAHVVDLGANAPINDLAQQAQAHATSSAPGNWNMFGNNAAGVAAAGAAGVAGVAAAGAAAVYGKDHPQTAAVGPAHAAAVETTSSTQGSLDGTQVRKASTGSTLSQRVVPPAPIAVPVPSANPDFSTPTNMVTTDSGATFGTPASPTTSGPPVFSPKIATRAVPTASGPPVFSPKSATPAVNTASGPPVFSPNTPTSGLATAPGAPVVPAAAPESQSNNPVISNVAPEQANTAVTGAASSLPQGIAVPEQVTDFSARANAAVPTSFPGAAVANDKITAANTFASDHTSAIPTSSIPTSIPSSLTDKATGFTAQPATNFSSMVTGATGQASAHASNFTTGILDTVRTTAEQQKAAAAGVLGGFTQHQQ